MALDHTEPRISPPAAAQTPARSAASDGGTNTLQVALSLRCCSWRRGSEDLAGEPVTVRLGDPGFQGGLCEMTRNGLRFRMREHGEERERFQEIPDFTEGL